MRLIFLKLVDCPSFGLLQLSQSPFLGLVGLGKDLHLIAHLFIETPHFTLKLLDHAFVLSLLFGPIFVILLDGVIVLLLNLSHILSMALFIVTLIIHTVLLEVFDGLFKVFYLLKVLLLVLLLSVLQIVILVLQQNLILLVENLYLISIIDSIIKLLFQLRNLLRIIFSDFSELLLHIIQLSCQVIAII